jgi:hypothetical protein
MKRNEAAYLFGVSRSSSNAALGWSLSSSTEGKDNRRVEMTKVVLLHRANLPYSVKTRPWHVRANRLPKPLEELQFLLLPE